MEGMTCGRWVLCFDLLPIKRIRRCRSRFRKDAGSRLRRTADSGEIEAAALRLEPVQRALEGRPVKKVIVVPQRIVNVVG